jgi:nicotinate phosphoribosyltransferase
LSLRPEWTADWTGQRVDSKDPFVAGDEYIAWLEDRGKRSPQEALIASDGLDVDIILSLHAYFAGTLVGDTKLEDFHSAEDFFDPQKWISDRRIRFSSGWGTLLTNDFRGCDPDGGEKFDPISLICKLTSADGRPAVKLSDNYAKATGLPSEIERYRRVFGTRNRGNVAGNRRHAGGIRAARCPGGV